MLDDDYQGFSFAPKAPLDAFLEDKALHPEKGKRSREIAGRLFCRMSNFVACNHGWHKGGQLVPSTYLQVEISDDQIDLLNPTARDVQVGAILDQCTGRKATKVIAKRRIDMVTGNVNSYARILNGPAQLEKIKTFNELSASIAALQREKDDHREAARVHTKKVDLEKAAKKLVKERDAKDLHEKLLPICQEHLKKGLDHVLSLNLDPKKDILKHVFEHAEVKSTLRLKRANELLRECISVWADENAAARTLNNSVGGQDGGAVIDTYDVALIPLPVDEGGEDCILHSNLVDTI